MRSIVKMRSNGNGSPRNGLAVLFIIIGIVMLFGMLSRILPWWVIIFIVIPMSGGWLSKFSEWLGTLGSSVFTEQNEPRRYDASRVPESVEMDEKPKRVAVDSEPRYALGDDGELIELPADERLSEPYETDDDADFATPETRRRQRSDSDSHYDYI